MKKIIFSIGIVLLAVFPNYNELNAVNVETPNGTPVTVTTKTEEYSPSEIAQKDSYYQNLYPNATLIGHSTSTYNCHAYAWAMSEGEQTCWMNQNEVYKYWDDYSYFETTVEHADKVFYDPYYDHSATASTTVSGMFESKWSKGPLMRHSLYDCPYYRDDDPYYTIQFYAEPPELSGKDILTSGESGTYSLSYAPLNTTTTWSYNTSLFNVVSSNNQRLVLTPKNSSSGTAYVSANLKDSSNQVVYTDNQYVVVGSPSVTVYRSSDSVQVYPGNVGMSPNTYYYAYLTGYGYYSSILWQPSHATVLSSSNSMMYFVTDDYGWSILDVYGKATSSGSYKKILSVTLYEGYNNVGDEVEDAGGETTEIE